MIKRLPHLAFCAALFGALGFSVAPARADRCDDLAKDLASRIDNMKVGATRGGIIYLQHPLAASASLGCQSRNKLAEFYAASPQRKPSPAFIEMVATAAAVVFTIPKDDALNGVKRCLNRIGLIRGNDIQTRYRKLDVHCSRSTTSANVTISREKDE
ncbi:MAG: hypothetical protein EKK40_12175 [Bradyrhizobiaceae bacterium]|nr:MAG: hypothetical protein EKK40_12175 [Bradyrhizobiaceae bacterium]